MDIQAPLSLGSSPGMPKNDKPATSALNLSVSTLQQHTDRSQATTSMNRAMHHGADSEAVSSVNRIGQSSHVSTSISHPDSGDLQSFGDGVDRDAIRDRLRYQHIRQMMREKKASELAAKKAIEHGSKFDMGIDTSSPGFLRTGAKGLERHIHHIVKKNKATFKNLSSKDQKYFLDVVEPHARAADVGHNFSRYTRKQMKKQIRSDYKKGVISKADLKDMHKMVDQLPKRKGFFGV